MPKHYENGKRYDIGPKDGLMIRGVTARQNGGPEKLYAEGDARIPDAVIALFEACYENGWSPKAIAMSGQDGTVVSYVRKDI